MADPSHDSKWQEVVRINSYALFMGYLSMAIRGLGFLAITWTTVVLLGGFVSTLANKDFWCLTMITLLQTAGIYDVFLNEKLGYINTSALVFFPIGFFGRNNRTARFWLQLIGMAVQFLVLGIVLCPLMALYMFGLLISTGISLWRLMEHDFGEGEAHLKSSLQVLYSMAVLQGALFIYRFFFSLKEKSLVKAVAEGCHLHDRATLVWDYSRHVRIGCEKDTTFANGTNLITFAVGLINTGSPDNYISGAIILDAILAWEADAYARRTVISDAADVVNAIAVFRRLGDDEDVVMAQVRIALTSLVDIVMPERLVLIKQLMGSTSSCHILQKLVQTLNRRSPYDSEMRMRAARIVVHLADHLHLEQFHGGTQCIISLLMEGIEPLKHSESYSAVVVRRNSEMVAQALYILKRLADDEDNCRVMSATQGLVTKITEPMRLHRFHHHFHKEWYFIALDLLLLLKNLITNTPGEAGKNLRREISSSDAVISTIETAISCDKCPEECFGQLPKIAKETLVYMHVDISSSALPTETKGAFITALADIIVDNRKNSSMVTMACENLRDLCIQCTENAECLEKLMEALTVVMPKVLREINADFEGPDPRDIQKQSVYRKLSSQPHYLSLCATIRDTLISAYPHLARQFDKLARGVREGTTQTKEVYEGQDMKPVKTFACLVEESQQFLDRKKEQERSGGHSSPIAVVTKEIAEKGDCSRGGRMGRVNRP